MENKPKPRRKKVVKRETDSGTQLTTETQSPPDDYAAREPGVYKNKPEMVPLDDERYLKKDKIGFNKAVKGPGTKVTRVGIGGLRTVTHNHIDYHGNIDVRSE